MKFILLIASILIFSFASCAVFEAKKQLARSVAPEDLALELQFYSTCQEFKDRVLPSVWISKHDLCLPIQFNVTENPDVDDLRTHYFCTNLEHGRSIVHFVEVYETDETVQFPNFVVSFVPTTPFRVLTQRTTVSRRPNCYITNDYCNGTNAVVNSCRTNAVVYKKGYVVSHDRIYITANQQESRDCRTSVTECCSYIAPLNFGGICEHVASTDVLKFPKKSYGNEKDGKKGRPSQGKPNKGNGKPQQHGKEVQNLNQQSGKADSPVVPVAPFVQNVAPKVEVQPQVQVVQEPTPVKQVVPAKPVKSEEEDDNDENDNENDN